MNLTAMTREVVHFAARARKWWAASCLGLFLLPGMCKFGVASAQAPDPQMIPRSYWNKTTFYLPVRIDEKVRSGLRELQLYEKDHSSRSWVLKDKKPPSIQAFEFHPPKDGEYWFTVVTVDKLGRQMPANVQSEGPGVIVVQDTEPPMVDIRQLESNPQGQLVQCEVRDLNPDPTKTRFEYQTADQKWRCGETVPGRANTYLIPAQAQFNGVVRVTAVDRAGNVGEQKLNLTSITAPLNVAAQGHGKCPSGTNCQPPRQLPQMGMNSAGPGAGASNAGPVLPPPTEPVPASQVDENVQRTVYTKRIPSAPTTPQQLPRRVSAHSNMEVVEPQMAQSAVGTGSRGPSAPATRKIISNTHVSLEYQLDQVGSSGVGRVEVWITSDQGQSWQRLGEDPDRRSPVEIDLPGEGLYGVSVVVSNGRGFGLTPPAPGDTPDSWIEVDVTKPFIELGSVRPGSGDDAAALWISWNARDKNLSHEPVDLYYSVNREGPWKLIAKGVRNDGRYRWVVPQEVGPLAFLRVAVTDKAGNSNKCDTTQAVALDDLSRPRAHVVGVASQHTPTTPPVGQ